MKENTIKIDFP